MPHVLPSAHFVAQSLPQSMSDSVPFFVPSLQSKHWFIEHEKSPMQLAALTHCTHAEFPSHTPVEHIVSEAAGSFEAAPALHASTVQSLLSFGRSASLMFLTTTPPIQPGIWQSPTMSSIKSPSGLGNDRHNFVATSQK
jgi:hypothetical protein